MQKALAPYLFWWTMRRRARFWVSIRSAQHRSAFNNSVTWNAKTSRASDRNAKDISTVFVLVDDAAPSKILGFYTLSAAQVGVQQLSDVERKKLPRYRSECKRH